MLTAVTKFFSMVVIGNSPRRKCTCYNGGTCIQHSNGFTCICPPKTLGMRCELGKIWNIYNENIDI